MGNPTMGAHDQDTSEVKFDGSKLVAAPHVDSYDPNAAIATFDARLFNAAPDMLAALVQAKEDLEHLCKYADDRLVSTDRITKTTIWQVDAAIAKATGTA